VTQASGSVVSRWADTRAQFRDHLSLLLIPRGDHATHVGIPERIELLAHRGTHRLVFGGRQWPQLAEGFRRCFNTTLTPKATLNLAKEIALLIGAGHHHAQPASTSEPIPDPCFVLLLTH
jgi:hypothetical protein